jgi:soluble lytic murein transglycosylase
VAEPPLAFTGSLVLAGAGEIKQSLYIAEILAQRIPPEMRPAFLSDSYRRLLFPLSYRSLILRESGQRGVDPFLLAAIIREESRFDPRAFSAASARGLTQFIYPTAQRIAEKIGLAPITPRDLEDPETAIALGAAYLAELLEEFGGAVPQMVAAYNAGEPQAALWRRYCWSDEPEEYLTKVAFRQTRDYLAKVLTSREHYAELYGSAVEATSD